MLSLDCLNSDAIDNTQWRLDFIAAQEAAKVLGEAADYSRQGQIAALTWQKFHVFHYF